LAGITNFLRELRRRNVFKVGVTYAIMAWLLIQIIVIIETPLHLPNWVDTLTIIFLITGFPVALLLAWAFELTPEGIKPTDSVVPTDSITSTTGRKFDFAIIGLMAAVIIFLLLDNYVWVEEKPAPVVHTGTATKTETIVNAPVETERKSIAVLPFINMSSDEEQEYFSDGLSEEILNLLAKNRDLKVIGRTSSFAYKGKNVDLRVIGEELGVQTVLEGSVRKSANKLRITAQLIKVEDGSHLWSETYDRELTDIFAIQDEVAAAIIDALHVHIGGDSVATRGQPTENMEAYSFFLKATTLSAANDSPGAVTHLLEATELDPEYSEAFELLAYNYWNQGSPQLEPSLNQQLVRGASAKALAINPSLVLADALFKIADYRNRYIGIINILKAATRKEPNNPRLLNLYIWYLLETGYFTQGLHWAERLKEIEPWAAATQLYLSQLQLAAGGHEKEAIATLELALDLGDLYAPGILAWYYLGNGQDDKAVTLIAQGEILPGITDHGDIREFLVAARDRDSGAAYIEQYFNGLSKTLSAEEAGSLRNNIPYWYMYLNHLDKFYEYLNDIDEITTGWTTASELLGYIHTHRHFGTTQYPGYLKTVEALGIMDLWEQHGPPDHCQKVNGDWMCN